VFNDLEEALKGIDVLFVATRHKVYEQKADLILKKSIKKFTFAMSGIPSELIACFYRKSDKPFKRQKKY